MTTAKEFGFLTPLDSDRMNGGAAAITNNAKATAAALTKIGRPTWGGSIPAGTDLNTFRATGIFQVTSAADAKTITGLPPEVADRFTLLQFSSMVNTHDVDGSANQRIVLGTGPVPGSWYQYLDLAKSTSGVYVWSSWQPLHPTAQASSAAPGLRHTVRRDVFRRRKGGSIGTAGRAVVCIRLDHGMTNLKDKIAPIAERLSLPLSVGLFSEMLDSAMRGTEDTGMTWPEINRTAMDRGWELWNHGSTHGPASGTAELTREIVGGLTSLRAKVPDAAIDGFIIPGTTGTAYDGFTTATTDPYRFSDTEAGQIIMANHGVSTGHGGRYWPLYGDPSNNIPFYSIDTQSAAVKARDLVDNAVAYGKGLCLFLHPYVLDRQAGEATTADLTALLELIGVRRDAGELEVLTMGGMAVADTSHGYRANLLRHVTSKWLNAAGWAIDEKNRTYTGTAAAGLLKTPIGVDPDHSYALGGTHEFYAEVTAETGAAVTLRVRDESTDARLSAEVTKDVPAGTTVVMRLPFTFPARTPTVWAYMGRASGGPVTIQNPQIRAI